MLAASPVVPTSPCNGRTAPNWALQGTPPPERALVSHAKRAPLNLGVRPSQAKHHASQDCPPSSYSLRGLDDHPWRTGGLSNRSAASLHWHTHWRFNIRRLQRNGRWHRPHRLCSTWSIASARRKSLPVTSHFPHHNRVVRWLRMCLALESLK